MLTLKEKTQVGYFNIKIPLEFSVGFSFYYCGKRFVRIMSLAHVKDLTHLIKIRGKGKILIDPEDYSHIKENIVFDKTKNSPVAITGEELEAFKKRFNCDMVDWIAPLLMKAISNVEVTVDYTKNIFDEYRDVQKFELFIPKYESLPEENHPCLTTNEYSFSVGIIGLNRKECSTDWKNTSKLLSDLDVQIINNALTFKPSNQNVFNFD